MTKVLYHTQEHRAWTGLLTAPIICTRDDAWLGDGYYFWKDETDAHLWGKNSKKRTRLYDVYEAKVNCENFLDTVFNENEYFFWLKQIEKTANTIAKKTGIKPTIKEVNDYFKEKATWDEVDGIIFQDMSINSEMSLIAPIKLQGKNDRPNFFVYKKRIQVAVYNTETIITFAHKLTMPC